MNKKTRNILICIALIVIVIISTILIITKIKKEMMRIVINTELGENIYTIQQEGKNTIYDVRNQNKINKLIDKNFTKENNLNNPLIIYNPYGTNLLSVNIYFTQIKKQR